MSQNIAISALILIGVVALVAGFKMDRFSSFENGSFLYEIVLIIVGIVALAAALIWKLVLSLLS